MVPLSLADPTATTSSVQGGARSKPSEGPTVPHGPDNGNLISEDVSDSGQAKKLVDDGIPTTKHGRVVRRPSRFTQ